jgi:hypothetical protein
MRVTSLHRHVALAIAIGVTFWAGVAAVGVRLADDASEQRAARDVASYRDSVREVFTDLYNDVQPLEDAMQLLLLPKDYDVAPVQDLLESEVVPKGLDAARTRLAALRPPPTLKVEAADLRAKLGALISTVELFPSLDDPNEDTGPLLYGAAQAVDSSLYELSVAVTELFPSDPPPTAGPHESDDRAPRSHAAYLVAAAHICGPATEELDALPSGPAAQDKVDAVIDGVLEELGELDLPKADAGKLKRSVVHPLEIDPPVAAEGLAAYGSRSCAEFLNMITWTDDEPTLNA